VTLVAEIVDKAYAEVNDARVVARVPGASGQIVEVPLEWQAGRDGEYRGTFVPAEDGPHEVSVEAVRGGETLGRASAHVRAAPDDAEAFDAAQRVSLLERIAADTGGRYYTSRTAAGLPEDITHAGRGLTVVDERDLWDMPALLLLLAGLVFGEWGYRRARGLA
jgi:hypothetical protein